MLNLRIGDIVNVQGYGDLMVVALNTNGRMFDGMNGACQVVRNITENEIVCAVQFTKNSITLL